METFCNLALQTAENSEHDTFHHGAVLIKGNRVLSTGSNNLRTRLRGKPSQASMHAEISAIYKYHEFRKRKGLLCGKEC